MVFFIVFYQIIDEPVFKLKFEVFFLKKNNIKKKFSFKLLDEHCDPIQKNFGLLNVYYTTKHLYLGTIAQFSCAPGYQLQNKRSLICLEGGRWSHFPPNCESNFFFFK